MFGIRIGVRALAGLTMAAAFATSALAAPPAQATPRSYLWIWGSTPMGGRNPVPFHGLPPRPVRQMSGANGTTLALLAGGTVWAWGSGPLGNGGSGGSTTPVQVTTLSGVTELAAAGEGTFYALLGDGTVWAWGLGTGGTLGDGSTAESLSPVQVSGLTGVTSIVANGNTAYALGSDGTVRAWGQGAGGMLGNGGTADSDVPVPLSLPDPIRQLASSCSSTTYALTRGGRIFAWGDNSDGQLGNGTRTSTDSPVLVRRVRDARTVVPGCVDAYAVMRGTGTVMAWGHGTQGEMGDRHKADRVYPVTVSGLSGIAKVSVGYYTTYAVGSDGTAWAWGYGYEGQLGDGIYRANSSVPVQVINITVPVTAVVSGQYLESGQNAVFARGSDGSLWSWGYGAFDSTGGGGSGASPGRVPHLPYVSTVFGDGWAAVH